MGKCGHVSLDLRRQEDPHWKNLLEELGGNLSDTVDPTRLRRHLIKRLESLGYEVALAENA